MLTVNFQHLYFHSTCSTWTHVSPQSVKTAAITWIVHWFGLSTSLSATAVISCCIWRVVFCRVTFPQCSHPAALTQSDSTACVCVLIFKWHGVRCVRLRFFMLSACSLCKSGALKVCETHIIFASVCVRVCHISRCILLEVIYMVMMSFTSEMYLPQHCQIGLIHTGRALCVCFMCVWTCFRRDSVGLQHLYPVIYQDELYLHAFVFFFMCVHAQRFVYLTLIGMWNCHVLGEKQKLFVQSESKPTATQPHFPLWWAPTHTNPNLTNTCVCIWRHAFPDSPAGLMDTDDVTYPQMWQPSSIYGR